MSGTGSPRKRWDQRERAIENVLKDENLNEYERLEAVKREAEKME